MRLVRSGLENCAILMRGAWPKHQNSAVATGTLQAGLFLLIFLMVAPAQAQHLRGELKLQVQDPQGAVLAASAELVSQGNQFHRSFVVGNDGRYSARDLPPGRYKLTVSAPHFAPHTELIEIRSEVPVYISVTMSVAPVTTVVQVDDAATLVSPTRPGSWFGIGRQSIEESLPAQPGRELSDLVNELPGWLYEANGVLHPRGSEYDVQYVVDGLPVTQNRSPAFASALDAGQVESMRVLTAGYPAEYGRKLGGIIEVTTNHDAPSGLHGRFQAGGGSFDALNLGGEVSYVHGKDQFAASADGFHTSRYLDPPVLANFTNRANEGGISAWYARDFSDRDRLRVSINHEETRLQVPNELIQEKAGQRQEIVNRETGGEAHYDHIISPDMLLSFSGSGRDAAATLSSNPLATPVIVFQDRGYLEGYVRGDFAVHRGNFDWKAGSDTIFGAVHEQLQYAITDPLRFDPGTQQQFQFSDRKWDIEPSAYVQQQMHLKGWNFSAGLRFDAYDFVVHESAWSPRLGLSRYFASAELQVHVSYDRVFQTPAVENLLLASSPQLDSLNPTVVRLPVRPARANYYEAGLTKAFLGKLRLDVNVFRRDFRNYSDDDVLLDTGISFPIAFARGRIMGEEARVEVPRWRRFSGFLSYANQTGTGNGPITGGLFLGSDAAAAVLDTSRFPVTQDQRNSARGRVRFQASHALSLELGGQYGSGLPGDALGSDPAFLLSQFGPQILARVNLDRGRVRPNLSMDAGAQLQIYRKEQRSVVVQTRITNLANRVNVINFASVFSGTAVAPPRSAAVQLQLSF
jgi:hypothetical protein